MTETHRDCQDFPDLDAAIAHLIAAGFEQNPSARTHFWHPTKMSDGFWQRADVWVLPNLGAPFARVGYWPANA